MNDAVESHDSIDVCTLSISVKKGITKKIRFFTVRLCAIDYGTDSGEIQP